MKLTERDRLKISGIYKITNTITKEAYIGQAKNICNRIYQHLHSSVDSLKSDYNYPLHKAFRKYGIDNFELKLIEKCDYKSLNSQEQYWIDHYDTYRHGYNQTKGGYQSIRLIKLSEQHINSIIDLLKNTKLTNKEIAKKFNVCSDAISRINTGRMWYNNNLKYPIRQFTDTDIKIYNKIYCCDNIIIEQLNKKTNSVINEYTSTHSAAQALGNDTFSNHINECCNNKRKSAYGYNWRKTQVSKDKWLKVLNREHLIS